jgi:hypothetical protein
MKIQTLEEFKHYIAWLCSHKKINKAGDAQFQNNVSISKNHSRAKKGRMV